MAGGKSRDPGDDPENEDPNETGGYASPPCFMHEVDPAYLFAMPYEARDRIRTKKIHDGPAPQDGRRVLVERLWPRGVSKTAAALDSWERDVAPSAELRKWYDHEASKWPEFRRRYRAELAEKAEALRPLLEAARQGPVTLLFSTRELERNSATLLREVLIERLESEKHGG